MKEISKLVYRLAKDDDMSDLSPSQDPNFLYEWFFSDFAQIIEIGDEMWVFFNFFSSTDQSYSFFRFHI